MYTTNGHNTPRRWAGIAPPVFFPAAGLITLLIVLTIIAGDSAGNAFSAVLSWVSGTMGWFYMLAVSGFLIFCLFLAFSRHAHTRLGPNHARPDYSFGSWFAMLFSAGIGIGLLFFGVAEPLMHFLAPPDAEPKTVEAAMAAMQITFFHWGVNAWAVYAVVGLVLAYFSFRHDLPLTIRSALYPLIGERIHGPIGHVVDVLAVTGTLFGVATSLGIGVSQINAGLNHLFDIPVSSITQVVLIIFITGCATISVVSGLNAGIKRLSELNMLLAAFLLLFVILLGPTLLFFNSFVQNIGLYMSTIVERSFHLNAYSGNQDWMASWTLFYWGWWISWSPFVGIFIARISRGRTIREFILGVLLVPSVFTFIWMTAFGNTALSFELQGLDLASAIENNMPLGLFVFLEQLPFSSIVSVIAVFLIITFFVTSSDSGSLVIDTITSGGDLHPPLWTRVFWATTEGVVAAVLMVTGGLAALQAATIATALPFTIVIILACFGLMRGLKMEATKALGAKVTPDVQVTGKNTSWKQRLDALLSYPEETDMENFIEGIVLPALAKVANEIKKSDHEAEVKVGSNGKELVILHGDEVDFRYAVKMRPLLQPDFSYAGRDEDGKRFYRAEVHLLEGSQHYDVFGYSEEQLIHDVLNQYDKHIHFLNIARK